MTDTKISKRYVKALFAVAKNENKIDATIRDIICIDGAISDEPKLMKAMLAPVIPKNVKERILSELFEQRIDAITFSFLQLLIKKGREHVLFDIKNEFEALVNNDRNIQKVFVTSAEDLSESEENLLKKKLEQITGMNIKLVKNTDPAIIGGLIIKIGDRLLDGSIKNDLDMMRKQLLG